MALIYHGPLVHSLSLTELQTLPRALLAVSESGTIEWLIDDVEPSNLQEAVASKGWSLEDSKTEVLIAQPGEFLMPGLIDTHSVRPLYPCKDTVLKAIRRFSMLRSSRTSVCELSLSFILRGRGSAHEIAR